MRPLKFQLVSSSVNEMMELLAVKQIISRIEFDYEVFRLVQFRRFSDLEDRISDLIKHIKNLTKIKWNVVSYKCRIFKSEAKIKNIIARCNQLENNIRDNLDELILIRGDPFRTPSDSSDDEDFI